MRLSKVLILVSGVCLFAGKVWAEDICPAGPFETDVGVISAAMALSTLVYEWISEAIARAKG